MDRQIIEKVKAEIARIEEKENVTVLYACESGPRNEVVSGFIEGQLQRLSAENQPPASTQNPAGLDRLFLKTLKEVNGDSI